jgi:hypothetical protein
MRPSGKTPDLIEERTRLLTWARLTGSGSALKDGTVTPVAFRTVTAPGSTFTSTGRAAALSAIRRSAQAASTRRPGEKPSQRIWFSRRPGCDSVPGPGVTDSTGAGTVST